MNNTTNVSLPPSAYSQSADTTRSSKYSHIDTMEVVDLMKQRGWYVADTQAAQPYKKDPLFVRHLIDFRHPDGFKNEDGSGRVVVINSHDGTKSATAISGFFRFVCENGLLVGDTVGQAKLKHMGHTSEEFVQLVSGVAENMERVGSVFDKWSQVQLSHRQREDFAKEAAKLRWGEKHNFDTIELLQPIREEDDSGSLYTVFNRVQEHATKGGITGANPAGRRVRSRELKNIDRNAKFNQDLWMLAESMAA